MSTNKKFRIQNGVDVKGELTVNDVVIIRADGTIVAGAIADAVSSLVDAGALTGSGSGSSIIDSDSQIFIDVNSNTLAIASETATRISDIANLQSQIDSLGVNSDTQAEVDSLQAQIDSIVGASPETLDTLVEIVSAFEGADSDIQSLLAANSSLLAANSTQITSVADDLAVETTRRISGDTALQNSLNEEIARATSADDLNAAAIAAEASARQTAISSLQASQFSYNDSDGWTGNLIPSVDNQYALGSPDRVWKDLYIGPGSLYINGTKILEDNSGTITMYADAGQNLSFGATGGGNIDMNAGDESVQIKSDLVMSVGETISTVGGAPTKFGGSVDMGAHKVKNVGAPVDPSDVATKAYVDGLNSEGTVSGDKVFEDNVTIQGNLSVEGTTTTLDTQTLTVADNIIDLNSNVSTGVPVLNAGIRIMRGDEPAVQLRWNELEDRWEVYDGVTATPIAVDTSDVVAEGSNNLYFTVVRAREAVSQDIADAVAAEAALRGAAIDAEIARATSAETQLAADIAAEATARAEADSDETAARISADATLQSAIDAEQAARIASDLTEVQTRQAAIADLQSQLDTVTGSDLSSIQDQIDAIIGTSPETLDTIQEVVAAFENADSDLTSLITGNSSTIAAVNASLTQEVSNRAFFDAAEQQQREAADEALQASIDAEEASRIAGDSDLTASLATETAARQAADTAEATARADAISAEATARVAGDATVQAAVDAEAARATAAEQANANAISAETTRALAAEADLQNKIDQVESTGATHPLFSTMGDLPDASANHGMFAHVHAEGAAFFAHGGQWVRLANLSDLDGVDLSSIQSQIDAIVGSSPETLDTLQEIVAAFENADGDLQTLMTANASDIASIESTMGSVPTSLLPSTISSPSNTDYVDYQVATNIGQSYTVSFRVDSVTGGGWGLRAWSSNTDVHSSDLIDKNYGSNVVAGMTDSMSFTATTATTTIRFWPEHSTTGLTVNNVQMMVPAETLDTNATTVFGAINELHAEMADNSAVTSALQTETDARVAAISAEQTARIAADADIASDLLDETTQRIAQASIETTARISADNALQSQIDAETTARQAGDASLQTFINAHSSTMAAETVARQDADSDLQSQIDTLATADASRAAAMVTSDELDAVQSQLDGEVVRAQLAEQANASAIVTGDAALQAQLDAIVGTSPETLDTLQEIVTAYSNADSTLQGLIDANSGTIAQLQTTIGANNVPLITPDIGETITYTVEYAGRQFYAVSDNSNVYVYDSVDPSTAVASIVGSAGVHSMDANSDALYVRWSGGAHYLLLGYKWADLVVGITQPYISFNAGYGETIQAFTVSETHAYAFETHGTQSIHVWDLATATSTWESGYVGNISVNNFSIGEYDLRVFGDKLVVMNMSGEDKVYVYQIAANGIPSSPQILEPADLYSDNIAWGQGERYGAIDHTSTLIAIGAYQDDTANTGSDQNAGSVYLFNPDNLSEPHTKLYPPSEYDKDHFNFGYAVAATDTRLIVSALDSGNLNREEGNDSNGIVFIYDATNVGLPPLVIHPPSTGISNWGHQLFEESNRLFVSSSDGDAIYVYDLTNMDQDPVQLIMPSIQQASGTFGKHMMLSPAATVSQTITDTIIPAQGIGNSVNYLESQRQKLRADLDANLAAIQTNTSDITSIAADVATNTANIATNAAAIVAVDADRTAFEASVNAERQAHRDAVQADIDQVNADRTAFEDTVNASQAQFIADHDSDYQQFTGLVSGSFAETNALQEEIRGQMGTGHIALPQETTSITYTKDVDGQYYTLVIGDNEFFVYTSTEYVENQSVQTGLGTRVVLPSTYSSRPYGSFLTRDHAIVLAMKSGNPGGRDIYFLVYELATIDSSSLPIAEVHADLRDLSDHGSVVYDGGSKVLIANKNNDSEVGSIRIYDVPSLVAGSAIFIETTSEDLPNGVNYPAIGSSDYGNFAYRVDWNSTHVFVGHTDGIDEIFVYDRTDLSYVTTLQDTLHGGGTIGSTFAVSDTMIVAVQKQGEYWAHQNNGRLIVWDAQNLNAAAMYYGDWSIARAGVYERDGNSYYLYNGDRKLAVSDDWLVFGNTYEVVMVSREALFNNDFPNDNFNQSWMPNDFNAVQAQFTGQVYAGWDFHESRSVFMFSPAAWGGITNRENWDYPFEISIQNNCLVVTSQSMRMSDGTSDTTGTVYIHDLNNFSDLYNKVEGVTLQRPIMIEEQNWNNGSKQVAVSPKDTVNVSVTETFNPNDSLTAAVNYLNAKKEELKDAVEAVAGTSTIVQDIQNIEANIDFKLQAQDQRFDSDKAEQIAIYDLANQDQAALYAAANAEQASIYDSANAAHVAYFEQYTTQETAAREASDATLQTNIDTEESARIAGDSDLQSQINTILGASPDHLDTMVEIVSAFENADSDLTNLISTNATNNAVNATAISALESSVEAIAAATEVDLDAKVPFVFVKKPEANTVLAYNGNNLNLAPIELTPNRESGETVDADMGYGVDVAVSSTKVVVAASNGEFFVYDATDLFAAPTIVNSGVTSGDFGSSVVMTEDVIAISSVSDGSYGTVKLYDASSYALLSTIEPSVGSAGMGYGHSMAIRGTTLVVSSPKQQMVMGDVDSIGFLYVYDITNASSSSLVATLRGPNGDVGIIGGSVTMNDRWIATSLGDKAVVWDRLNLSESPTVFSTGGLESGLTQGGIWGQKRSGQQGWSEGIEMPLVSGSGFDAPSVFTNQINIGDQGDWYSYQFVGYFKAPETADFTFRINSDNQGVMWIGSIALQSPTDRGLSDAIIYQTNVGEDTATVSMIAGEIYPILMSYTENIAGAWFQFTWKGGAQTSYTYDLTQHFYYYAAEANFSPAHIPVNSIEPIILEDNKMYIGSYNGVSIWNDISSVNTTDYTDWKQAVAADSHVVAPNNEDQFGVAIGLMSGFLFVGSNSQSISVFEVANLDNPPNVKLIDSVSSNLESVPAELAPPVAEGLLTNADSTIGAINEVHNELDAEVVRALGIEAGLRTDVDANSATINTNIVDIANETAARISGDSDLQAQIDNIVGTSPETLDTIQEVVAAFQNADNDIQTLISTNSTEISSLQNEIRGGAGLDNLPSVMTEISRTVYQDQYMVVSGSRNGGSVYVFDANNPAEQPVKLMHPDNATDASFGHSVAVVREYLVVGSPYDGGVSSNQGAVFVYELADLTVPPVRLDATETESNLYFGYSVTGTDEYIIVGAPSDDDSTSGISQDNTGSVYLFDINDLTGVGPTVLSPSYDMVHTGGASNRGSNDDDTFFGWRLEVVGDALIVGAKNKVDLYRPAGQKASHTTSHMQYSDYVREAGAVYVYDLTNLLTTPASLTATVYDALQFYSDNNAHYGGLENIARGFGQYGIAMNDTHLFVGMPFDDMDPDWYTSSGGTLGQNNGLVAIFERYSTAGFNSTPRFIWAGEYEDNQQFGYDVAVDEDYLYVGIPNDDNAFGSRSGQVKVYDLDDVIGQMTMGTAFPGSPGAMFTLNAPDGSTDDRFGLRLSVNGGKLAVVAPYEDDQGSNSGAVYLYQTNLLSGVPVKITPSDFVDQDITSDESTFGYNACDLTIASGAVEISDFVLPNSSISTGMNYLMHRTNQLEQLANDVNINAYNYANNISVTTDGYGQGIADNAAAIATETTARADGDAAQQVQLDSLTVTTTNLTTQLNDEITRATAADSDLNERVDILSNALQADSDGDITVEGLATFSDGIAVGSSGGAIGHDPSSNAITILSDLDMNDHQVLNIAEPTTDKDVTTKLYVDTQVSSEETRASAAEANLQGQIDHIVGTSPETLDTFQEIVATLQGSDSDLLALMTSNATGVGGLGASLTLETEAREAADTTLQSNIDAEAVSRAAGDSDLQAQIDSNDVDISNLDSDVGAVSSLATTATTVVSAINEVHSELDAEVARATAAEGAETTRATDAEAVLQSNINTESSARIAGDANLQSQVDVLSATQVADKSGLEVSIAAEVSRATLAENTLQSNIDAEELRAQTAEAANAAAVVTEQTRAEAVEAGLAADIAVETARATAAEAQLANHLGANFTDGSITVDGLATFNGGLYFGDGTGTIGFNADVDNLQVLSNLDLMGNRIINYPTPVDSGDVTTKGYVDATTQAVSDRVDAILQGAGESLDTIVEVVAAFENADSDIQSLITSNSASVTANTNAINAEVAARQQAILDEASARRNADSDLSAGLSNETSRALAAEGVLTSDLAAEVARATSAETGLAADIAAEASRATAAEGVNATAISAETTRATTVEASLAQDIADETLRAQGAEAVLTSDVSANATAISNLQSQVAGVSTSSGSSNIEMTAEVDMSSNKITNMADPTAAQDAATKSYVDATVATEATARTTEDSSLQSNIDAANARIDAILNGSVESLDTVVEVVSAFEGADSDIQNLITANASTISQNATAIATEATARANADSDESALRAAADAVLTADLAATNVRTAGIDASSGTIEVSSNVDMNDNNITGVNDVYANRSFIDTMEAESLTVETGTVSFEGSIVNFGSATLIGNGFGNATNNQIDQHLNQSAAGTNEFLKWNGTDYEFTDYIQGQLATNMITVNGTFKTDQPGSTIDFQDGLVHFGGSEVIVDEPTGLNHAANKRYVDEADSDLNASLSTAIANEESRATTAEGVLTTNLTNEIARATSAEATLASDISAEETRALAAEAAESSARADADSDLQSAIDAEVARATAAEAVNAQAVVDEATARTTADTTLQSNIDTVSGRVDAILNGSSESLDTIVEVVAAFENADSDLQTLISSNAGSHTANAAAITAEETRATNAEAVLQSAIDAEETRATGVEADLQSQITSEIASRSAADQSMKDDLDSDIAAEAALRSAGDATLQSAIDVEVARATAAEGVLQSLLDSEQSARILSDQGLQSAITAEENARVAADAVLQSAIDAEELARTSADNTLQANIDAVDAAVTAITNGSPETLNQLVEVVAAFEDADSDLQTLIANLGGDASALTARVSTLEGEMDATELATTSNANAISAETAARVAAVQVNADAITAESTARAAAITAEQNARAAAITASESDRDSADADLQAQITALTTTEQSSKSSLQALLNQEVADRTAGDSDLTDSLAAEVARATAAESALSSDISDESSARATADASLQTQIDNILSNTDATALNSLAEIVTEFQSVDGTLTGLINSNGSRITALESSVGIIEAWNTDNVSEGTTNLYFTDARAKACLTGGLCIDYNSTTGEIAIDEVEAASSLTVAESHDANALGGEAPSYYRINVYDAAGNLVN